MHKSQSKSAVAGILILFFFVLSCTKIDTTNLGKNLIPEIDNIHTFDTTVSVIAKNSDDFNRCDSVSRTDLHALGIISNDPYFGKTAANIYVELKPSYFPFRFPDHDVDGIFIDSAVIVLKYINSFGDTNAIQKVNVYGLTNNFKADSIYKTCDVLDYSPTVLGSASYMPHQLNDSIHAFREDSKSQLRIPIDKFIAEGWASNPASTVTDSAFRIFNKGYAIVSDTSAGGQALNYFDLTNISTRLSIYVRTKKGDKKDTAVVDFPMTIYSAHANSIVHNRGNAEITQHVSQPAAGDEYVYLETSPGSYAHLTIPAVSNLSNRIIHRAELIMDQVYSTSSFDESLNVPRRLYLDIKDSAGRYIPIPCDIDPQEIQTGFTSFGGKPSLVTDANGNSVNRYVFNITRYVQNIVTNHTSNGIIRLSAPYYITNTKGYTDRCNQFIAPFAIGLNTVANGRVKLTGTNDSASKMRLHIIYSTLQ